MKRFAFATTLCDTYVKGFLLTLCSILSTTKNFNYDIIVFEWGNLSLNNKELLRHFYKNIIFKKIEKNHYGKQIHDTSWRKWTYNCNYRFDIFTLTDYDRVIAFDSDILFEIDVNELLSYDVDFGACIMPYNFFTQHQTFNPKVFNAGLMSIGKKYLNERTKKDLIHISTTSPKLWSLTSSDLWFGNQPILNNYFYSNMFELPEKFNFLIDRISSLSFKTPKNYHFIGHKKPWNSNGFLEDKFDEHVFDSISGHQTTQMLLLTRLTQKCDFYCEMVKKIEQTHKK